MEEETVFHVSRELFRGNTEGIREEYKNSEMSEELISMVGCITGVHHITKCAKEGERNMCRAIDEMLKKLEEETTKHVVKLEKERVCREMLKNSISREIIECNTSHYSHNHRHFISIKSPCISSNYYCKIMIFP